MKYQTRIEIDKNTLSILKSIIGKKLLSIYYVSSLDGSFETYLSFENEEYEVVNDVSMTDCYGEEYSRIQIKIGERRDTSPYKDQFEKIDINCKINRVNIIADFASWNQNGEEIRQKLEDIIIFKSDKIPIILYAADMLSESVEIYLSEEVLKDELKMENMLLNRNDDVTYRREVRTIAKLED